MFFLLSKFIYVWICRLMVKIHKNSCDEMGKIRANCGIYSPTHDADPAEPAMGQSLVFAGYEWRSRVIDIVFCVVSYLLEFV